MKGKLEDTVKDLYRQGFLYPYLILLSVNIVMEQLHESFDYVIM